MSLSYNHKAVIATVLIAVGGLTIMLQLGGMVIEQTLWPYVPGVIAGWVIWAIGVQLVFNTARDRDHIEEVVGGNNE